MPSARGRRRVPRRRVPLPGRGGRRSCATSRSSPRPGTDHGHRRQHGQRQVHADQPHAALLRRDLGQRPDRRGGRPRASAGGPVAPHRSGAAARVPLQRDRGRATCATASEDASDEELVARAQHRPGARLRGRDAGRARRPHRPGRHQRLGRPATAPGHRPGHRQAPRDLHLRRQFLGAGLQRPTCTCARRSSPRPATRPCSSCPAGGHDHARRPDHRAGRGRDRRHRHARGAHGDLRDVSRDRRTRS